MEKIKRLENDLGRYHKKVSDQGEELAKLRQALEGAKEAGEQQALLVDGIIIAVTCAQGTVIGEGDSAAWRLELPRFDLYSLLATYRLNAQRTEKLDGYLLEVTLGG